MAESPIRAIKMTRCPAARNLLQSPRLETPLTSLLARRIRDHGPITFRDWMAAALYDPEHGYYAAGPVPLGRRGDYFTSVSVGPVYGRWLAAHFCELWAALGQPETFTIVEQGAHDGTFATDLLTAATATNPVNPEFAAAIRYQIVEPLPRLAQAQRATLALHPQVAWFPDLATLPPFTGIHFSNELVDSFPVHRLEWTGHEWQELRVAFTDGRFTWHPAPLDPALLPSAQRLKPTTTTTPFRTELNPAAQQWLAQLAPKLQQGWIHVADYGLTRAELQTRADGTLRAYHHHQLAPDPLAHPGAQDLTTHVDWTSLAEAAQTAGLTLADFTDQHHLLIGLAKSHWHSTTDADPAQLRRFQTLQHPGLMGRSFQHLLLSKNLPTDINLSAFQFARPNPLDLAP